MAILYDGAIFACRHCYDLAYESQRETADGRAVRRADRIRERLAWTPDIVNDPGGKPKGMHWRTFTRLKAEHDAWVAEALAGMTMRIGCLYERLDGMRKILYRDGCICSAKSRPG